MVCWVKEMDTKENTLHNPIDMKFENSLIYGDRNQISVLPAVGSRD